MAMPGADDATPGVFRGILAELRRDVEADPGGNLSLGGRIRLWDAMRSEYGAEESGLRRGFLAYVVTREAASRWDPARLPDELAPRAEFAAFPGAYLEAARRHLSGEVPLDRLREAFRPLMGWDEWIDDFNREAYNAVNLLERRLVGEDDETYEDRGYYEVVRRPGAGYRKISEDDEWHYDVHYVAAYQAVDPDGGGPAEVAARRAFWHRWLGETAPLALGTRESVLAQLRARAATGR